MAGSTRDAKLILSVEALGQENLTKLETELRNLAKTGSEGAGEFTALADEVARLGDQNAAIQAFKKLAEATDELAQQQVETATRANDLTQRLNELKTAADQAREKQARAAEDLVQGRLAYVEAGNALRDLKAQYKAGTVDAETYSATVVELVRQQNAANSALVKLRAAQKEANKEVADAESAVRKQTTQVDAANKAMATATKAASDHANAVKSAGKAAEELGVDTSNVADAEASLVSAFNKGVNAANARRDALAEMAEADRLAAIEARTLAEMVAKGERDMWAEVAALRDAEKAVKAYEAAKAQAVADAAAWQREADAIVAMKEAERAAEAQTKQLVEALREAEAVAAFERQAEEARKLVQAAEYVRAWEQALAAADAQQAEMAAKASTLQNAFATLDIRPLSAVQAEIQQVNRALDTLKSSGQLTGGALNVAFQQGQARIAELEREARQLTGTLTLGDKAAKLFANSLGQITAGNIIADGVGYLVEKVKAAGVAFLDANIQFDSTRRVLTQVLGSAEAASTKIEYLRDVAKTAGVSVGTITKSFLAFQASASAAGIATSEIDGVFKSVTVSAGKMGLSSDQVSRALEALGQMASKGTVSLEELRQQLGDALPGSFAVAAKGLGMTTSELGKLVESGNLTVNQFFPAFRAGLEQTFGSSQTPVQGLSASFGRLATALTELYQKAADSAALRALGSSADWLATNMNTVATAVGGVGKAFLALKLLDYIKSLGTVSTATATATAEVAKQTVATDVNTAATRSNTVAKEANVVATRAQAAASTAAAAASTASNIVAGATVSAINGVRGAFASLTSLMGGLPGLFLLVATNSKELGTWLGETAAKWMGWGKVMADAEEKTRKQAQAEKDAAAARQQAQLQSDQAFAKEVAALVRSREMLELRLKAVQDTTKAEELRAQNIERVSALYGQESTSAQAALSAADIRIAALSKEAEFRSTLLLAMQAELVKRDELIAANNQISQAYKDETDKLREKVEAVAKEVDASNNSVRALQIERTEREIYATTLKDNSDKVTEFKDAVEAATATLADLKLMQQQGLPVAEALGKAELDLAKQTALYSDALRDKSDKLRAQNDLVQANYNLEITKLTVAQRSLTSLADQARATGNYTQAIEYEIQAKETQIKITQLQADAKKAEAQASIDAANAERETLTSTGQLTDAKRLEIDARIANAKAKLLEAGASADVIKALQNEIDAIKNRNNAATGISSTNSTIESSARSAADALDDQASSTRALTEEEANLLRGRTKDGWAINTNGEKVVAGGELTTFTGIFNYLKSAGMDETTARSVANQFLDSNGKVSYTNTRGQNEYGGSSISEALTNAIDKWQQGQTASMAKKSSDSSSSSLTTVEATLKSLAEQTAAAEAQAAANSDPRVIKAQAALAAAQAKANGTTSSSTASTSSSSSASSGTTYKVTVNLGGSSTTINTASAADASALATLLKQLETYSSTAS